MRLKRGDLGGADDAANCALAMHSDQGQLSEAIAVLESASNHDVEFRDVETWFDLAVLHDRNADAESALRVGLQVSRLAPKHVDIRGVLARRQTSHRARSIKTVAEEAFDQART